MIVSLKSNTLLPADPLGQRLCDVFGRYRWQCILRNADLLRNKGFSATLWQYSCQEIRRCIGLQPQCHQTVRVCLSGLNTCTMIRQWLSFG